MGERKNSTLRFVVRFKKIVTVVVIRVVLDEWKVLFKNRIPDARGTPVSRSERCFLVNESPGRRIGPVEDDLRLSLAGEIFREEKASGFWRGSRTHAASPSQ